MSENRKYYYMKLKENFFTDAKMVILESMQDGLGALCAAVSSLITSSVLVQVIVFIVIGYPEYCRDLTPPKRNDMER